MKNEPARVFQAGSQSCSANLRQRIEISSLVAAFPKMSLEGCFWLVKRAGERRCPLAAPSVGRNGRDCIWVWFRVDCDICAGDQLLDDLFDLVG